LQPGSLNFLEPSGPIQACNGIVYLFITGKALFWSLQSQVTLPQLLLLLIMIMIKYGESSKNNFVVVMKRIMK
jgi:hypothetical protein